MEVQVTNDVKNWKTELKRKFLSFPKATGLLLSVSKKAVIIAIVYAVCYFKLSFLWLIGIAILLGLREQQSKDNVKKHDLKLAASIIDEKEAILHRFEELPSWVMFPDVDRAEWLNKIIKQLWPNLNKYIVKVIRRTVQNKIRKKFDNFKFEEVDIGYVSPRIDGVKVYNNSAKSEIVVDFDVFYDGDCDINFTVFGTKGSINDFQMSVELRIILKPIIPKLPLIGGLQIFFLNCPDIDFTLEGIANIPGFKHFIKRRVLKIICKKLVFPNGIPLKISKSLDAAELKSVEPEGVLRVHVLEAKDLEKKDVNVLCMGKSDPYAVISVGAQEYKTKIIDGSVDPKWDFWCEFCILDPSVQHLDIEVLDHDLKSDDFLGSATIDLDEIVEGGITDQWITLEKVKKGQIHLRYTWLTLSTDYSDLEAALAERKILQVKGMSTALLTVFIDYARNIPQLKPHKKPDPYLALTLGSKTEETKAKKHTTEATWEQGFMFLVSNPNSDSLYLTMIDKKHDEVLDQHFYPLHNLIDKPNLEISNDECRFKNGTIIKLSLELRILKYDPPEEEEDSESDDEIQRKGSMKSNKSGLSVCAPLAELDADEKFKSESLIEQTAVKTSELIHRTPSVTSSAGVHGLGRILVSLKYSEARQKLVVTVHKIANLPLKDPSHIPDPYVKLQLIPGGSHNKRKTKVIVDNCNPVYNETFEYVVAQTDLPEHKLLITVKTKIKFSLYNNIIGQVQIEFENWDVNVPIMKWYDLKPEFT